MFFKNPSPLQSSSVFSYKPDFPLFLPRVGLRTPFCSALIPNFPPYPSPRFRAPLFSPRSPGKGCPLHRARGASVFPCCFVPPQRFSFFVSFQFPRPRPRPHLLLFHSSSFIFKCLSEPVFNCRIFQTTSPRISFSARERVKNAGSSCGLPVFPSFGPSDLHARFF